MISMIRQPSDTPNILNTDDFVPIRYAYGNQNGYVKDKGSEISYTINGNIFKINSGRLVLHGVESDIDANGVSITVDTAVGIRYYTIYYHVDLANNTASIESEYDSADYPEIDEGDDLTENSSGYANLVIYKFQSNNGVISNVNKFINEIEYINTNTVIKNATNSNKIQNVDLSADTSAEFGDYKLYKVKNLWSGSQRVTSEAVTIELSDTFSDGDILEVVWGNVTLPSISRKVSRGVAIVSGTTTPHITCRACLENIEPNLDYAWIDFGRAYISFNSEDGNVVYCSSFVHSSIQNLSQSGNNVTCRNSIATAGYTIYEINKIVR